MSGALERLLLAYMQAHLPHRQYELARAQERRIRNAELREKVQFRVQGL